MFRKVKIFFIVIFGFSLFSLIYSSVFAHDDNQNDMQTSAYYKKATLSISGSYTTVVHHDTATIQAYIETYASTAKKATIDNALTLDNIRKALKDANINPETLISKGYNVQSNYDYIDSKKVFRDYQVIHEVSLTIKNLKDVGKIVDLLTMSGVNNISNITFTSSQAQQAYDMALKNAVMNAKEKAILALSGLDTISLGKAISIDILPTENVQAPIVYNDSAMLQTRALKASVPTDFKTQGQTVTVHVNSVWELLPK